MAGPTIYQGATKVLNVSSNIDLTTATEIEVRIDTPDQIIKTLTGAQVSNVTTAGFDVTIDAVDTADVREGNYKYQMRVTDSSGNLIQGRLYPNKVKIMHSVFENPNTGCDYN